MKYKSKKEILWSMGEPYYRYMKFDGIQFLCSVSFRNPFKRYYAGITVPKIELLPRVALTFNRAGKSSGIEIGFLNFYFSLLWMNKYKIVTTKVEGKVREALIEQHKNEFHVIKWKK